MNFSIVVTYESLRAFDDITDMESALANRLPANVEYLQWEEAEDGWELRFQGTDDDARSDAFEAVLDVFGPGAIVQTD